MTVPLIWADFNAGGRGSEYGEVLLTKRGTLLDLERQQVQLVEGMVLRLFDCAEDIVHFNASRGEWYLLFPLGGPSNVSEARKLPNHWASSVDWPAEHQVRGFRMD